MIVIKQLTVKENKITIKVDRNNFIALNFKIILLNIVPQF